ncbi:MULTISPECIES: ABC transporter ATP-binding protein [Aestuariimicrobium]|uniref:ABC transporter ATP-binding protein n=1 Tax=Aestuariimicrobium TaxID=396388 RepID=UPI0003B5F1FB|nr:MULTISPECIES: ATP-binding cassette domain-containing protein [Aestuariimicrobium]CAI9407955.1 Vitamin B12 import ATP-binding protein BtuD [Aestuariimicrobium sp. T2.26MG-19.2B]
MIIEAKELGRDYVLHEGSLWRRRRVVKPALDGLDLTVEAGAAVGYLGANGAGKSTTIKMLTGILTPTRGQVRTCGLDPVPRRRELARQIGVVFGQRSQLWWDLPLGESYPILSAMHRLPGRIWKPRFDTLVDELDLSGFLGTPVRQLSLGQRMRGEVAAALVHSPDLLILDEPTIGLDMLSKERLRHFLVRERTERGTTLFLTTHDLSDVQRLCERMVIIDRGRVAFDGTEAELAAVTGARRRLVVDVVADDEPVLLDLPAGAEQLPTDDASRLQVEFASPLTAAGVLAAVQAQCSVVDIALTEPTIEELVGTIYRRASISSRT